MCDENKKNKIKYKPETLTNLKSQIEKSIEKTGFPLEFEVGKILKKKGWYPAHSYFYRDLSKDLVFKEIDINATKFFDNFNAELFIECKHSEKTQWVFFIPTEWIYLSPADLKFLPRRSIFSNYVKKKLDETIFNVLEDFCDFENIALNHAVFQGQKKSDSDKIRIAINQCVCSLISRMYAYYHTPKDHPLKKNIINFACVVFDGPMFVCKPPKIELHLADKVKYRHIYEIPLPKIRPVIDFNNYLWNTLGNNYIIEFIHLDYFPKYLARLNASLKKLDETPKSSFLRGWA